MIARMMLKLSLLVLGSALVVMEVESMDAPQSRMHGVRKTQSSCIPGTLCVDPSPPSPPNGGGRRLQGGLQTLYELSGNGVYMSIDGSGNGGTGSIQVEKPSATAVVQKAILMASTNILAPTLDNTDIALEGTPWTILHTAVNPVVSLKSYYSDMTSVVQPIINAQPAGIYSLTVTEVNQPDNIDGEVLVVVFSDPANPQVSSASILFGALSSAGDQLTATFQSPITAADLANPSFVVNLSLGIGFSYQDDSYFDQYSTVDVNGQRLTSFAGGLDDGYVSNGGLITVGGIGDSNANPVDPFGNAPDDELYTLVPFLSPGDTSVLIQTVNPSNDDIVFFAGIYSTKAAVVVNGYCTDPFIADAVVLYDTSGANQPPNVLLDGECVSPPGTVNIEAKTKACGVNSVKMALKCNGVSIYKSTENTEPWFLFANDGATIYTGQVLPNGSCVLTATTYSQKKAKGTVIGSKTIGFHVGNCTPP